MTKYDVSHFDVQKHAIHIYGCIALSIVFNYGFFRLGISLISLG